MYNKFIISAFSLLLCCSVFAQQDDRVLGQDPFQQQLQENKIEIYPNPAVKHLTVEISNSSLENVVFELHSIIGNQMTIRPQDLGNGKFKIPVDGFATGYYFLLVIDEEARFKRAYKFLKD